MKSLVNCCFILLLSLTCQAAPKDTLQIEDLKRRVVILETDNKILLEKINAVNLANDKILSAFYTLINIIITVLVVIVGYNLFQNWKTNTARLAEIKDSIYSDLKKLIPVEIGKKVTDEISGLSYKINDIEAETLLIKAKYFLKRESLEDYSFYESRDGTIDTLIDLLAIFQRIETISIWKSRDVTIEEILQAIISYTKKYPNLDVKTKQEIFDAVKKVDSKHDIPFANEVTKILNI